MADDIREVHETTTKTQTPNGATLERTRQVRDPAIQDERETDQKEHHQNVAARVIWFIAGIILVILAFRFVFSLLGANQNYGFGGFIYSLSRPFVAPFFGLFAYHPHYGASSFEIYTLVAMAVVALIAYGLSKLTTITKH